MSGTKEISIKISKSKDGVFHSVSGFFKDYEVLKLTLVPRGDRNELTWVVASQCCMPTMPLSDIKLWLKVQDMVLDVAQFDVLFSPREGGV